jgi:hypothetical protein
LRNIFKFSKPHGPGFGINKAFYLSVLAAKSTLPPITAILNPKASNGALKGFGVPMIDAKDKALLDQPMLRGQYALATEDRKTVLRLRVIPPEEAGFSGEAIARSSLAKTLSPELVNRLRSMWHLCQFTFESHDPDVYPALDFLLGCTARLGELTEGVIADPVAERYLLPNELLILPRADEKVDAREHVMIHWRPEGTQWHAYTRGLFKFIQPEFELYGIEEHDKQRVTKFLLGASQAVLLGHLVTNGSQIGPFEARQGGLNRALWDGLPVMELLPPTKKTVSELTF